MNLPPVSVTSINLLPPNQSHQRHDSDSVFSVLNKTVTSGGKSKLKAWVSAPLTDMTKIVSRQDSVSTLYDSSNLSSLRSSLNGLTIDLSSRLNKVSGGKGDLKCLYDTYVYVRALDNFEANLDDLESYKASISESRLKCANLLGLAEAVIDMDRAPREFVVRDGFDEELTEINKSKQEVMDQIETEYRRVCELWSSCTGGSLKDVRLENPNDDGWEFRIPDTNSEKKLRNIDGIRVCSILKNGVHFETKASARMSREYKGLQESYKIQQKEVVKNALDVLTTFLEVLRKTFDVVSEVDALQSMAYVASTNPVGYVKPTITDEDDGVINIVAGRHPCVEHTAECYIPNDYDLGKSTRFNIITGPNMGGKSTYIRGLGSIVAMAQIGSFVPAESATINICDAILCRVGAGDLQNEGVSTFMAEMLEAKEILTTATSRSLIIIDELGRGTSTMDGYGLAWAISEYICNSVKAPTVFATHFHEVTRLAKTVDCATNLHVGAIKDGDKLVFLYKVEKGACLESFGVRVAEMADVPGKVIAEAKRKATELENFDFRKKKERTIKRKLMEEKILAGAKEMKGVKGGELLEKVKVIIGGAQ